ncbi:type IV pilus assembly protein PilM [Candidatus Saccharibacteria bacterium]|jgi:type IV pilus assembly protein PilM|nr:type IV pilus assembly protein PilM [Candidatus Saccharibacteria bacterium]
MKLIKGMGDYFSLDIGTKSIRVVQLSAAGEGRWKLDNVGYSALDARIIASDSAEGRKKLSSAIIATVAQAGINTKNVVVGLPSTKTFTTVIEVPVMSDIELKSTLKYQADQYIPMPLDDAKIDWAKLGPSPRDAKKQEVLLASTAQSYVENLIEMIDSSGFNVIAAEPDPVAIIRSLLPVNPSGSHVVLDVGEQSTDIVVTIEDRPVLVRTLPMGLRTMVGAIVQNLNIKEDQASQFILKFGLDQGRLEGQVFRAVEGVLDNFASEIAKSIKFFQNKYNTESIAAVHLSGYAGVIPHFKEYIAGKTSLTTDIVSPWQKVNLSDADRQKVQATEYEFATAVGLAQRVER